MLHFWFGGWLKWSWLRFADNAVLIRQTLLGLDCWLVVNGCVSAWECQVQSVLFVKISVSLTLILTISSRSLSDACLVPCVHFYRRKRGSFTQEVIMTVSFEDVAWDHILAAAPGRPLCYSEKVSFRNSTSVLMRSYLGHVVLEVRQSLHLPPPPPPPFYPI